MSKKAARFTTKPRLWPISVGAVRWLVPTLVVVLSSIAFFPSLRNQFVQWDDNDMFIRNLNYRGLGWTELRWMFSTFLMGHYQPLSWVTLGLDYLLWGMDPFGYHLTNLLVARCQCDNFLFYCGTIVGNGILRSRGFCWHRSPARCRVCRAGFFHSSFAG